MGLFSKKKHMPAMEIPPPNPGNEMSPPPGMDMESAGIPIDAVLQLRQQGLSNNQITQTLQRDGFSSEQIFEAINQADVKGGVSAMQPGNLDQMAPIDNPMPQQYPPSRPTSHDGLSRQRVEEIAESIVNEKFEHVSEQLQKLEDWKDGVESSVTKIQQNLSDLQNNFDKVHQALIGKISEYDKNIINVGTEIKAMEKVFQKLLPTFTENVNELQRYTKTMKKTK